MENRIYQLSKAIEETFVASYDLMQTNEEEDNHALRQPLNINAASKDKFEQMVICQRMANQVADRFLMDLQQADILIKKVKTQGWQPSTAVTPQKPNLAASQLSQGTLLPMDHLAAIDEYEAEIRACVLT